MSLPKSPRTLTDLLLIFAGPAIWFAHFVFIYGAETLICLGTTGTGDRVMFWIYALATIAALAALGLVVVAVMREKQFLPRAALALAWLAVPAVIWTAVPALLLSICTS